MAAQIDKLFQVMVAQNASDMHLSAGAPPILRIHGEMVRLEHPSLTNENVQSLIFEILNDKQKRLFVENWELDCSYQIAGLGRFRVNVFMQRKGMGGVFRVIPEEIKTVHELGLPPDLLNLVEVPRGLVLVTGPTGSGKSTTLAALLHTINCERKEHIITIEDPIEFVHENRMCLINQREVSSHTKSFANALKASLREDPDIILVGEMRDLETIHLAMTAAETGHLVFGTLHTNNAAKTVDRIIDVMMCFLRPNKHKSGSCWQKVYEESSPKLSFLALINLAEWRPLKYWLTHTRLLILFVKAKHSKFHRQCRRERHMGCSHSNPPFERSSAMAR
jgi:twitching motility protein PilT